MCLSARLAAFDYTWKTYTSMNEFRSMCVANGQIWAATEGGLIALDPATGQMQQWTNTEGLAHNEATAICSDSEDRIWIGFYNGLVQRYDSISKSWIWIEDYEGIPVTELLVYGDTLFVGLDIGVSLYLISRSEVKETYRRLGSGVNPEIPVNTILVHQDTIWVGTDQGAAFAELGFSNLLDPQNWTNIQDGNGLPGTAVNSIAAHQDQIYIGADAGVLEYPSYAELYAGQSIQSLLSMETGLQVLTNGRLYRYENGSSNQIGPNLTGGLSLSAFEETVWIGTTRGIVTLSDTDEQWTRYQANAPEHNKFIDFAVDRNGTLWCASATSEGGGFSRFDGTNWRSFNTQNFDALLTNNVCVAEVDLNNDVWIGTFGRGILHFHADTLVETIYLDDGIFAGITNDPNYVVVPKILVDHTGNVWFANFESLVRRYIISRTPDGVWTHYSTADGINLPRIRSMIVDALNRLWIGEENKGVLVYDFANTPTDKSDDVVAGSLTNVDGLDDEYIRALAEDAEGTIWIGTGDGLYSYRIGDPVVTRNWPSSDNIFAIVVDGVNNIWVGHDSGISFRLNSDYSWHHFHTDNSYITDNAVTTLYCDPVSGNVYVGTNYGMSVISTPFSEPLSEMKSLRLYPNPFIPEEHGTAVIDDLSQNVSVGIYSMSGFLIQKYSTNDVPGRQLVWDGTDRDGNSVPSGVYLVVAKSESGEKQIGKLAVVR